MSEYTTRRVGVPNTIEYRLFIERNGQVISPWHDIPLFANENKSILNFIVEIPRWTNAKMEISKEELLNPIKQDVKKGKLRYVRNCFPHHGYIWNYGAFPQTWEDPTHTHAETKAKGDNDPLDVCEIGEQVGYPGQIKQVKVLGIMALLDEGETDWKVIVIDVNDPLANKLNDIEDVERHLPGLIRATNEWFRIYKIPDGKPENQFAFSGEAKNKKYATEIIHETHEAWRRLLFGQIPSKTDKYDVNITNLTVEGSPGQITINDPLHKSIPQDSRQPPAPIDPSIDKWFFISVEVKKQPHSAGGSRPTSSHSSRPQSSHSSRSEVPASLLPGMAEAAVKQKPKVNPFGDAKPREVLLEEKGLDWKKIDLDLEHRSVDRPETEDEKNLKEEIELLTNELQQKSGKDQTSVNEIILQKQQELDLLVRQLDDKVRYSQKAFERHGSGAGRGAGFHDRPPSRPGAPDAGAGFHDRPPSMREAQEEHRTGYPQRPHSRSGLHEDPRVSFTDRAPPSAGAYEDPRVGFSERPPSRPGAYEDPHSGFSDRPRSRTGVYEEPRVGIPERSSFTPGPYQEQRAVDYGERPRSRGTVNSWGRPRDDRRATQGGGGRGFLGNRDVERSGSRW